MSQKIEYIKQDPISHILLRPDMYVGSKELELQCVYIFKDTYVTKKEIQICPALIRTFVEILSNAIDNIERDKKMTYIKVSISSSEVEIINDGSVIPIEKNEKEGIYNHSLIFGHLLSGSNYDDSEKRFTSGRNGLGAKLTNVLSTLFEVEAIDSEKKLKFNQVWTKNMRDTKGPVISKSTKTTGYTKIRWIWDKKWFNLDENGISQDVIDFLKMHVYNTAMITGLNVSINNIKLSNKINKYFDCFDNCNKQVLKLENEHSVVLLTSSNKKEFEAISFVNGIQTKNGGKHVNAWIEAVCKPILEKLKSTILTLKDIKPFFRFLISTKIPNPTFESQEKNELKTPLKVEAINSLQVSRILKWEIGNELKALALNKEKKRVSKALAISHKHPVIEGYDKANNANTSKSKDCILIVCEGLSAKTFAVEGISIGLGEKRGRDWFGIYPLRGKILNTRNATPTSIKNNTVITNLINILGLDYAKPEKIDKLNYGKICIITDADVDGIHIEGLILNFFHSLFPNLLKHNFVISMKTPILKITKTGLYFFDERSFNQSKFINVSVEYYKGLGTTNSKDIKKIFGIKILEFNYDDKTDESFQAAFDKDESYKRKELLANYSPHTITRTLDDEKNQFIKFNISRYLTDELIKFFHDDCKRSIPNIFDGLKESQRKIIYSAKKRNLHHKIKVAQFGAYVAEHTNYHHGEENLFKTIIKMAQTFPGSNNLPLFIADGQFGSRLEGGEDAASPRYIYTKIPDYFNILFNSKDDSLLKYRIDDGDIVEPYFYIPVIPLLLVNGCLGIGTGWMSNIPSFNPKDILYACKLWISNNPGFYSFVSSLKPWFQGFNGVVEKICENKFQTKGIFERNKNEIRVSELPIGLWNSKFQQYLDAKHIMYKNYSLPDKVDYILFINDDFDMKDFEKKMYTSINLDNLVVFNENEQIIRVSLIDIFNTWGQARIELNKKRKNIQLEQIRKDIQIANCKINFIQTIHDKKINLLSDQQTIIDLIKKLKITNDDEDVKMLLDLPIRTLTLEKKQKILDELEKLSDELKHLEKKTEYDLWFEDVSGLNI